MTCPPDYLSLVHPPSPDCLKEIPGSTEEASCVCETLVPLLQQVFWKIKVNLIFGTKERGLATWNTHEKYESSITYHSKVMAKRFFADKQRLSNRKSKHYMPHDLSMHGVKQEGHDGPESLT